MEENFKAQWWKEPKGKRHETITSLLKFIDNNQGYVQRNNLDYMRLYANMDLLGLSSDLITRVNRKDRITLNVIQSMVDTVTNKIAKNRPRPMFLTDGGDFSMQMKSKKLQKFVDGVFYATKLYDVGIQVFRDACVFGTGVLKVFEDKDEICIERVFTDELKVDETEGVYGKPRQIHQTKSVSREVLLEMFPDFKYEIERAEKFRSQYGAYGNIADQILVRESWHLPSGEDTKDGSHLITIENADLLDEPYDKPYFPFVWFKWSEKLLGFFGQGLAEQLLGIQIEINKLLRTAQLSLHLCGVPKIYIENGAKIATPQLNNEVGGIVKFTGQPPIFSAPNPVPPQLFEQINNLYQRAYEITGISVLAAQAKKPSGLDSGKALREFSDIESERFATVQQRWEEFFLEAARQFIEKAKEINERTGKYSVLCKSNRFMEKIAWKEVNLKADEYIMQIFPTSSLSKTPSGRFQDVQEMVQAGFINKDMAIKLLDFPDLEAVSGRLTAQYDVIEQAVERMLDAGKYLPPEPYQNLQLTLQMTQEAYLQARVSNVPEDRLELLRRYMSQTRVMLESSQPSMQADQAMAQLAQPEAAPTSDLMPFQAGA